MFYKRLFLLSFLLILVAISAGCVVTDDHYGACYEEVCDTYCDVYCDPFGCWEECWDECYCADDDYHDDVHDDYDDVYDDPDAECARDRDCDEGESCVDGDCERDVSEERGEAQLCDPCTSNEDCEGEGSRCLDINDDERVCAAACAVNADCPSGFECAGISLEADAARQCLPLAVEGRRSCVVDPDACVLNVDCEEGRVCVDGRCQALDPAACQEHADCAEGEACMSGVCAEVECFTASDCEANQTCVDARCLPACAADADCEPGLRCDPLGFCAPSAGCNSDADCAPEQTCIEGVCLSP